MYRGEDSTDDINNSEEWNPSIPASQVQEEVDRRRNRSPPRNLDLLKKITTSLEESKGNPQDRSPSMLEKAEGDIDLEFGEGRSRMQREEAHTREMLRMLKEDGELQQEITEEVLGLLKEDEGDLKREIEGLVATAVKAAASRISRRPPRPPPQSH